MSAYRLRVRIGGAEFEAEGEEAIVRQEFADWKELVGVTPATAQAAAGAAEAGGSRSADILSKAAPTNGAGLNAEELRKLLSNDEARKLISLKFLPQGDDRASTAMLLILLGYKKLTGTDEVAVTQLKSALAQSGLVIDRVDRDAATPLLGELVLKGGKAKGGRYKLTNSGVLRAESEARKLLEQI